MSILGIGIAIIENGRILLTKRQDVPVWCIPGGHLDPAEFIFEAAIREAKEETGLDVELTGLVGLYSLPNKGEFGSFEIIFSARPSSGKLIRNTDETVDAAFYSVDELPDDLVGWQRHQAIDALSNSVGVLSILDESISISPIRNGRRETTKDLIRKIITPPKRIDISKPH